MKGIRKSGSPGWRNPVLALLTARKYVGKTAILKMVFSGGLENG